MAERIDIHQSREDGGWQVLGYWCRGHVDIVDFARRCREEWTPSDEIEEPRHTYYRTVPCGEGAAVVLIECHRGPGAFAVTVADVVWPRRPCQAAPEVCHD